MVFHAAVMYPNEPDAKFDEDYYMKSHMPLVESTWKKHGLQSWHVIKYTKDLSEALQKGLADPESKKIFEDITNFTNVTPITLTGPNL
ncbi:hypothetical protein N7468_001538 [Penicillium chermesinum]|uniref:EthD domain-containing protein n=1 Tax=Penicillium chermesinum TaxID=63820 RepID=A0A9W9PH03_9EURO|nr:uncharacterized protein N7468_001538 [Penicillium chermesinum]KAJ5246555.1 hypothetical protein N7468_001538 [Penicillium chermesinum]KAJ6144823.1 hypothetical protein N7470_008718 [Penicillium chermesinum]